MIEEFLADVKKEFGRGDKELVKVAELKDYGGVCARIPKSSKG